MKLESRGDLVDFNLLCHITLIDTYIKLLLIVHDQCELYVSFFAILIEVTRSEKRNRRTEK